MQEEQEADPELKKEVGIYLEDTYKEYVKEKYFVENPEILLNPAIMKMVFALEWYDIPRTAYSELIEFHPYLNFGDYDKLKQIDRWHNTENTISVLLFSMMANRLLFSRSAENSILKRRRLVRLPLAMTVGGLVSYVFNLFVLRPIYLEELHQYGLSEKYFFLDLNADMMREDLKGMGISIDAKHFDMEQTERRLAEQELKADNNTKWTLN